MLSHRRLQKTRPKNDPVGHDVYHIPERAQDARLEPVHSAIITSTSDLHEGPSTHTTRMPVSLAVVTPW